MTTPSPLPYRPGQQLRVTADEPYATELHTGDIVTVVQVGTKDLDDGTEAPVVFVMTGLGHRWLGLDAVEPFTSEPYAPAEPDEIADAILERMARSDLELLTIFRDTETSLATGQPPEFVGGAWDTPAPEPPTAEDPPQAPTAPTGPSAMSTKAPTSPHPHNPGAWFQPDDRCDFRIRDFYGDLLHIQYAEAQCSEHGREGTFFFAVNQGTPVMLPVQFVRGFVGWLAARSEFFERPAED